MIAITVKDKKTALQAEGKLTDVTLEATLVVNNLYNAIARVSPAEGERFREMVRRRDEVWKLNEDASSVSGILIPKPGGETL